MAQVQFPSSPTDGQQYIVNNVTYTWNNTAGLWEANNATALADTFVDIAGDTMTGDLTPAATGQSGYISRTGTTLSPSNTGDSVDIGSGNIALNVDGTASFVAGKTKFDHATSLGGYSIGYIGGIGSNTDDGGYVVVGAGQSSTTPTKKAVLLYAPSSDGTQTGVPYINFVAGDSWAAQGSTFGNATSVVQTLYATPGASVQNVTFQQRFDGAMRWGTGTQLAGSVAGNVVILNDGTCKKVGGGSWSATSDERAKESIVDYTSGLTEVKQLRPRSYRYIGNDNTYIGLVAQETEGVMPEMVSQGEGELPDGTKVDDFRTLESTALTFALVNAVKEMSAEIDDLKARLDAAGA